jgi:hypothetical protein
VSEVTQSEILETMSFLEVKAVDCGKARVGGDNDGGYVMANDFERNEVAYSIGVGPQVIWDVDMARRGMTIHQYDHTVPGLPEEHPNFRYERLGIGTDMSDPELIPLDEMVRRNGHSQSKNMLLKIDVEGAEWDVFDRMDHDILEKFDQIVIEFHGLEYLSDRPFHARATRVFRKLNFHHVPVHVHANNYGDVRLIEGISIPTVIEISYARRGRFTFHTSEEIFPTSLDQPCRPDQPDIFLGRFRFRRQAA